MEHSNISKISELWETPLFCSEIITMAGDDDGYAKDGGVFGFEN